MSAPSTHVVGRDRELATLAAMLPDARAGRGRVGLLLGDAGIGKSTIVQALAEAAGGAGFLIAWGRCTEGEAPSYWPWVQALRELGCEPAMPLAEKRRGARAELFASVVEAIAARTTDRPVAILLEDVHWADLSSLALLRFVTAAVPGLPLVLALTARDDPADLTEEASAILTGLPPAVLRLTLDGLDRHATGAVVQQVVGADVSAELVSHVHERTGGNPFFITEVARLHVLRGAGATIDVPAGVQQVLGRRLARISQTTADMLGAAAVLGEPNIEVVAALTGGRGADVLCALDEAVRARVLVTRDGGFHFAHALVRETLYENLSPATRARLHQRAAETLESTVEPEPSILAFHWARAEGAAARRRAALCELEGARVAMAGMAYEQAVQHYRRAIDGGAGDHVGVRLDLGEAQVLAGQLSAGRQTLRKAARAAALAQRPEDLARGVLAMGTGIAGFEVDVFDDDQVDLLKRALALLPDGDSGQRAAVMARLSLALAGHETPDERASLAGRAAEMAGRIHDSAAEVSALGALCDAQAGPDHVAERLGISDRMLRLAEQTGNPVLILLARRLRLVAQLEAGNVAGVDAEIAAYARISRRLRLPLYAWLLPIWRGMRAAMEGDLDAAWRYSEEAAEEGRQAGSANAHDMVFTLRAEVSRLRGRVKDILPALLRNASVWEQHAGYDCMLADLLARAGDLERARRHLKRLLARGLESIPRDSEWVEYVWSLGEAAIRLDEREAAVLVHDALHPYTDLWAVDGMGGACFGPVSQEVARLAEYLGRPTGHATRDPEEGEFRRDGHICHLRFRGARAIVPDSKGMHDLAILVAHPDEPVHVLDLVAAGGGPPAASTDGNTGPLLDAEARTAYRSRLVELRADIDLAESRADIGRDEKLRAERDFIVAELSRALGIGGRVRHSGDREERARKAITMRIGTAQRMIDAAHPALARHLRAAITTGRFCAYRPEHPTRWRT